MKGVRQQIGKHSDAAVSHGNQQDSNFWQGAGDPQWGFSALMLLLGGRASGLTPHISATHVAILSRQQLTNIASS
jgi:hypothetical protein